MWQTSVDVWFMIHKAGLVLHVFDHRECVLTVGTLFGPGSQQKFGHGHVVGHDGDVERQQSFTVGGIYVQLLQTEGVQQRLHDVQLLMLHGFKQSFVSLELDMHAQIYLTHIEKCML